MRKKQHIIITGGAQGIGRIVSQELLHNDYTLSIFDIDGVSSPGRTLSSTAG